MKVLVTGADGFIGIHLIDHLRATGDDVVGWTRDSGSPDIRRIDEVTEAVAAVDFEVVYHLAGQADVARSWIDPGATIAINAGGTANLFAALAKTGSGARVLVMSSAEVYGRVDAADLPLTEAAVVRPASPYGVSKFAAEEAAKQAWRSTGQPMVICRPFNHIGPGQSPSFVASAIARRIVANERSGNGRLVVGDLSATRDFLDVRDGVRALRLLIEHGAAGETYNLASGRETSIQALVDLLRGHSAVEQELEPDPALLRPSSQPRLVGSNARLHAATGWSPTVDLQTTASDILDYWRSQPDEPNEKTP